MDKEFKKELLKYAGYSVLAFIGAALFLLFWLGILLAEHAL